VSKYPNILLPSKFSHKVTHASKYEQIVSLWEKVCSWRESLYNVMLRLILFSCFSNLGKYSINKFYVPYRGLDESLDILFINLRESSYTFRIGDNIALQLFGHLFLGKEFILGSKRREVTILCYFFMFFHILTSQVIPWRAP